MGAGDCMTLTHNGGEHPESDLPLTLCSSATTALRQKFVTVTVTLGAVGQGRGLPAVSTRRGACPMMLGTLVEICGGCVVVALAALVLFGWRRFSPLPHINPSLDTVRPIEPRRSHAPVASTDERPAARRPTPFTAG